MLGVEDRHGRLGMYASVAVWYQKRHPLPFCSTTHAACKSVGGWDEAEGIVFWARGHEVGNPAEMAC
jgi:hypothetical protein